MVAKFWASNILLFPVMKTPVRLILLGLFLAAPSVRAANDSLVTAVFSKVSNGYHRQKLADGSFQREYYALANGVYAPGVTRDRSIDAVRFPQVAKLVAQFLALQNYYLAPDSKSADLLLMITWGTSVPFDDSVHRTQRDSFFSAANSLAAANAAAKGTVGTPDGIQSTAKSVADAARDEFEGQLLQLQVFEDMRRKANEHNAQLLGYVDEINYRDNPTRFAGAGTAFDDLISDIEAERYYVIIAAYDFRAAKEGKRTPLWVTRVSVQAQGNKFNETLVAMLARAARYFGRDSGHLIRQYQPNTRVDYGELQIIGVVPASSLPGETPTGK
jgi:hypothetical protein